jgi:hypothetical protein
MNSRSDAAKLYRKHAKRDEQGIHEILLRDWDPIGVADELDVAAEYDGHIPKIHGMLIGRVPRQALVEHLWRLENDGMGMPGDRVHTEVVVDRLIALRDEIEGDP